MDLSLFTLDLGLSFIQFAQICNLWHTWKKLIISKFKAKKSNLMDLGLFISKNFACRIWINHCLIFRKNGDKSLYFSGDDIWITFFFQSKDNPFYHLSIRNFAILPNEKSNNERISICWKILSLKWVTDSSNWNLVTSSKLVLWSGPLVSLPDPLLVSHFNEFIFSSSIFSTRIIKT